VRSHKSTRESKTGRDGVTITARSLMTVTAVTAILFFLWSFAAPWAAAFPPRPDHYKVTLFGVRHIADIRADAAKTSCSWNDPADACRAAPGAGDSYKSLSRARWFMLASLVLSAFSTIVPRRRNAKARPLLLSVAALSTGCAIILVRANVASALEVFAGATVSIAGSGLTAAAIASMLCLLAASAEFAPQLNLKR
jgi:hypothetical protein